MSDILFLVLSLSLSGSIIAIILLLLKPFLIRNFTRKWNFYIWLIVLLRMILPFSFYPRVFQNINLIEPIYNIDNHFTIENMPFDAFSSISNSLGIGTKIIAEYFALLWIFGIMIIIVNRTTRYYEYRRFIISTSFAVQDKEILACANKNCKELKILKSPKIIENKAVPSPMLMGIFNPIIILPTCDMDIQHIHYIIRHELIHFKRGDILYKWFLQFVSCIHWFNPLMYWISKEISRNCEFACDEMVLASSEEKVRIFYGDALISAVNVSGNYNNKIASVSLSEDASLLNERLQFIIKYKTGNKLCAASSVILAVLIAVMAAFLKVYAFYNPLYFDPSEWHIDAELISQTQVDDIALQLMDISGNWDYVGIFYPYLSQSGLDNINAFANSQGITITDEMIKRWIIAAQGNKILNEPSLSNSVIKIMDKTGTWNEGLILLFPFMSPKNVDKVVSIYLERHQFAGADKALEALAFMSDEERARVQKSMTVYATEPETQPPPIL